MPSEGGWPLLEGPGWEATFGPDTLIDINAPFDPMDIPDDAATGSSIGSVTADRTWDPAVETPKDSESSFNEFSLDRNPDFSSQIFGFTNESDPFLLNHFAIDTEDEVKFFRLIYRKMENSNQSSAHVSASDGPGESVPTHFLRSHRQTVAHAVEMVESCLSGGIGPEADTAELHALVDVELGTVLIRL